MIAPPAWLRRKAPISAPPSPSVGDDRRVYAIGDIHGRDDLLRDLLALIARDSEARGAIPTYLILLGDLVDRGRWSAQVIERAMELARTNPLARFVKGNHEEAFLMAARGHVRATHYFRQYGGTETAASYGLALSDCDAMDDAALADWMLGNVPRAHVDFVDGFEDSVTIGDYFFVHAGVKPGVPLHAQSPDDLRWIRAEFLDHRDGHEKMIVHGHNISENVDERSNRIGIDTGAYRSGRLTAIGLQGTARWFLQTGVECAA